MDIQNSRGRVARPGAVADASRAAVPEQDVSAATSIDKTNAPAPDEGVAFKPDSWWSHVAYGLGTVALVAPMFVPGVPLKGLMITYLALGATAMIIPMAWGAIRASREAWRIRRRR